MTLLNDGGKRCELCYEETEPVTPDAAATTDM